MRIFIDADACPVKEETLKVADRYDLEVFIVSNGGMRPSRDPLVKTITVAAGPDVADDWIADNITANDIVVTQDIPLAARTLESDAHAVGPSGKIFNQDTIGMALAMRDLNQQIREANQSPPRHRSFSGNDRSNFLQALDKLIVTNRKKS